ncbi:MAG: hypothetical protein DWQ08_05700 [Proteobacteria bacterium]|nr:MAG: hypothetical protein DWQ08_05700 [Pseudomonadota bacterium]
MRPISARIDRASRDYRLAKAARGYPMVLTSVARRWDIIGKQQAFAADACDQEKGCFALAWGSLYEVVDVGRFQS